MLSNSKANACAHWFARRDIPVFPLVEGGKTPANHNGFKGAVTGIDQIGKWWPVDRANTMPYNLGIPTGVAFDVIDIDPDNGGYDSCATLDWLWIFDQPTHAVVVTQSGGLHFWQAKVVGRRNSANMAPGIDMRGEGGYVVAPPSETSRGAWRFLQPYNATPRLPTDLEALEISRILWTPRTG